MSHQCAVHHNDRECYRHDHELRDIEHGAVFRIQLPPPLLLGQAVGVAHQTGELLDFPEAGQLAYSIMDGTTDHNRREYGSTHQDGARLVSCIGSDHVEDMDIPMTFPPLAQLPDVRPKHDGSFEWLFELGQIFRNDAAAETIEGEPLFYVQTWYVHEHLRQCRAPRPVRLDGAMIVWVEELRFAWRVLLDRRILSASMWSSPHHRSYRRRPSRAIWFLNKLHSHSTQLESSLSCMRDLNVMPYIRWRPHSHGD